MPTEDRVLFERQLREGIQMYAQWASLEGNPNNGAGKAATVQPDAKILAKEKARMKREAASGWYRESTQPFNPIVVPGQGEHGLAVVQKDEKAPSITTKSASVPNVSTWLWKRNIPDAAAPEAAPDAPKEAPKVLAAEPPKATEQADETKKSSTAHSTETVQKPKLPEPEENISDLDKLLAEMREIIERIKESENEHQDLSQDPGADSILYRRFIDTILVQKKSREDSCQATQEKLFKHQEIKHNIYKKMCELRDKQIEADKAAGISGWVGTGLTIGIIALFVVSVVATIATGGAASPVLGAALTIAQGVLGVGSGINTGVGGYYKYQGQKSESELYGVRHLRGEHDTHIKTELGKHKESNEWVSRHVSLLRQVQKSRRENTRFNT